MKHLKYILLFGAMVASYSIQAKKVKFAVDMTGQTINATGVHVMGDFQEEAGYPNGDWQSNTTPMLEDVVGSNVYSVVVDIPAFQLYQYRFLNGDQSYDSEFIPEPSRVGYDFVDNRWLYIDSLANDTTFVGAIMFGANAPAGLTLMRFLVDMQQETVSDNGAHLSADFTSWAPEVTTLYSFVPGIYEVIAYSTMGEHAHQFVNGNTSADGETIDGDCAVGNQRVFVLSSDSVFSVVCYGSCAACATSGITNEEKELEAKAYPNPSRDRITVVGLPSESSQLQLFDAAGNLVYSRNMGANAQVDLEQSKGFYIALLTGVQSGKSVAQKLIWE